MNRTDRLYALVEELRAVAPRTRSARQLAERFEVSTRTIERDLSALQAAGVPVYAEPGRRGGYTVDPATTLPPLNVTAEEAMAVAVALAAIGGGPFHGPARSALRKVVAAMPPAAAARAREWTGLVRLVVDDGIAGGGGGPADRVLATVRRATLRGEVLRLHYGDRDGVRTEREVEPALLLAGPRGWYLVGHCRLRGDGRAFRLDRVADAAPTGELVRPHPVVEPQVPTMRVVAPALT